MALQSFFGIRIGIRIRIRIPIDIDIGFGSGIGIGIGFGIGFVMAADLPDICSATVMFGGWKEGLMRHTLDFPHLTAVSPCLHSLRIEQKQHASALRVAGWIPMATRAQCAQ